MHKGTAAGPPTPLWITWGCFFESAAGLPDASPIPLVAVLVLVAVQVLVAVLGVRVLLLVVVGVVTVVAVVVVVGGCKGFPQEVLGSHVTVSECPRAQGGGW